MAVTSYLQYQFNLIVYFSKIWLITHNAVCNIFQNTGKKWYRYKKYEDESPVLTMIIVMSVDYEMQDNEMNFVSRRRDRIQMDDVLIFYYYLFIIIYFIIIYFIIIFNRNYNNKKYVFWLTRFIVSEPLRYQILKSLR